MEKEDNVYEETTPAEEFAEASKEGALTVLGKFKDVGALMRAYESLQAEFTRRSQRLRELERASGNFKDGKGSPLGVEKLRKTAKEKREEQKEFDAFVADMVCPSVDEVKPDEALFSEGKPEEKGEEKVCFNEANKEAGSVTEMEKLTVGQTDKRAAATERDVKTGEVKPSIVGDKAQGVTEDLFEKAVNDEGVRLRIIGEYLSSLGKTNAPLTAVGGGTFATPPAKAKTVGEAGNMALLYFRKPTV